MATNEEILQRKQIPKDVWWAYLDCMDEARKDEQERIDLIISTKTFDKWIIQYCRQRSNMDEKYITSLVGKYKEFIKELRCGGKEE